MHDESIKGLGASYRRDRERENPFWKDRELQDDLRDLEVRIVSQMTDLYGAGAVSEGFMTRLKGVMAGEKPPPKEPVTADRVMRALVRDPTLLFEVASRLQKAAVLSPWLQPESDAEGRRSTRAVKWAWRTNLAGGDRVLVMVGFAGGKIQVVEWRVLLPNGVHYASGETETVLEAQRKADEMAREAGWMLSE